MNGRLTQSISIILGSLSLILLIVNIALINSNRHLQDTANARQAEISKGTSLASLNQALVQALAEAAVNNNDTAAKDLLAAQGITINPSAVMPASVRQAPAAISSGEEPAAPRPAPAAKAKK